MPDRKEHLCAKNCDIWRNPNAPQSGRIFSILQSSKFEVSYGGGEANVAVSLANYGMNATFVSKVPEHEIGQCAINELRRYGVDTKFVARGGNRLGVYFCEKALPKGSQKLSTIARILQYPKQILKILIGI